MFFAFPKLVAVLATLASVTLACQPNFEGNHETIYAPVNFLRVNEWTPTGVFPGSQITLVQRTIPAAFAYGEFLVPFTGQYPNTYQIKLVADTAHRLALTAGLGNTVSFQTAAGSVIPSQTWSINCQTCPVPGSGQTKGLQATHCSISNPATGKCVTGNLQGQTIHLATCIPGSVAQTYSFYSS